MIYPSWLAGAFECIDLGIYSDRLDVGHDNVERATRSDASPDGGVTVEKIPDVADQLLAIQP